MAYRITILFAGFLATMPLAVAKEPGEPTFIVHTAEEVLPAAPILKLADDWSIQVGGKAPRSLAGADLIALRRVGVSLPPFPQEYFVLLTSGDRIPVDRTAPLRVEEERLIFRPALRLRPGAQQELSVPLTFVQLVCLTLPEDVDDPGLFLARLEKTQRPQDLLILKSGDRLEGAFTALDAEKGVALKVSGRLVETGIGKIALLAGNSEWQVRPRVKKAYAHVVLRNGARLNFASLRLDEKSRLLTGKALFGAALEVPLDLVASLNIQEGRAVYLSELTPKDYQHTPFLGLRWPLTKDSAVTGRPMRLGGNTFDRGIGVHAQARVSYSLEGAYRWFEAVVGIDEHAGGRGRARVGVLVDGRKHDASPTKELSALDAPLPLRIDVRKARELTLLVEFGSFGDVQAHVNWANARLIRE